MNKFFTVCSSLWSIWLIEWGLWGYRSEKYRCLNRFCLSTRGTPVFSPVFIVDGDMCHLPGVRCLVGLYIFLVDWWIFRARSWLFCFGPIRHCVIDGSSCWIVRITFLCRVYDRLNSVGSTQLLSAGIGQRVVWFPGVVRWSLVGHRFGDSETLVNSFCLSQTRF